MPFQEHDTKIFILRSIAGDPSPTAPPENIFKNNFKATSFVFQEAYQAGLKKIIFASSNFYDEGDIGRALQGQLSTKITLSFEPTPQSLYGKSKVFGENLGLHFSNLGMQFIALRIGWTVPGDNPVPYAGPYMAAMFCSKGDLLQAVEKALNVNTSFLSAFVISDNNEKVFDLDETKEMLGYFAQDNYENFFKD